jgi:hypothetical protein
MWSQLFFVLLAGADLVELNHEMGVADGVLPFVPGRSILLRILPIRSRTEVRPSCHPERGNAINHHRMLRLQ